MKKNEVQVIEPNQIIEAKLKRMSKGFLDTLYVGMTLVADTFEEDDPERIEYSFYVKDLEEKYRLEDKKSIYRKLKDQVTSTMEKDSLLYIRENGEDIRYFVFQEVRYADGEGKVTLVFTNRFKRTLHQMLLAKGKKAYFGLRDVMGMKSEYSKKMYPILLEYIGNPMTFTGRGSLNGKKFDRIDTLDNFKALLCIPKSYVIKNIKDTCNLIAAEIEAYTPYHVEVYYNQLPGRGRYGGKISHVCWTMKKKEKVVEKKEKMVIDEVAAAVTEEEDNLVSWIMDMTGLDQASAEKVAASAETNGRDKEFILRSYQSCMETGAHDLGRLMNHHMKNGVPERKTVVKKSPRNFTERPAEEVMKWNDELLKMSVEKITNRK